MTNKTVDVLESMISRSVELKVGGVEGAAELLGDSPANECTNAARLHLRANQTTATRE